MMHWQQQQRDQRSWKKCNGHSENKKYRDHEILRCVSTGSPSLINGHGGRQPGITIWIFQLI